MDTNSKLPPGEWILKSERIHRGIFCVPVILLLATLVCDVPVFFILHALSNTLRQIPGQSGAVQNGGSILNFLWISLGVVSLLPTFAIFLIALLTYLKSEVTLTNKRLLFRTAFLIRTAGELSLDNADAIFIVEPILGRLFGYGTVGISTLGGARFPIRYIAHPAAFHSVLQNAVNTARQNIHTWRQAPPPQPDSRRSSKV
jgi:uncharacterized membrane protein YdbT with pleckstrin-like domain